MMITKYMSGHAALQLLIWLITAYPTSTNLSTSGETYPMCTTRLEWLTRSYDPNDCVEALYRLEDTDYKQRKALDIDFLAPGAAPSTFDHIHYVRTPLRYTVRSCTLVIAMLSTFPAMSLPHQVERRTPYAERDRSKFTHIRSVASWVDSICIGHGGALGWCATGANHDIGVLFVATDSNMNREIQNTILKWNSSHNANLNSQ